MRTFVWSLVVAVGLPFLLAFSVPQAQSEESLGSKIKRIFEPTPPPKRKKTSSKKKASPTPSPTATPKGKASPSPSPKASPSPSPKVTPSPKAAPSPSPKQSPSPSPSPGAGKKKKKSSPTPSPSPTPSVSPSPETSPSPSASPAESPSPSPSPSPEKKKDRAGGVTIPSSEIAGFDQYPEPVRKLIESVLELAGRDLSYKYGSADPANGGMDCSGFVYYLLRQHGINDVPRDSSGQYVWVRKSGAFQAVVSKKDDTFELNDLKPGDLLFWTGTYDIERDPPITHAMIYLGKEKGTGRRIMIGASDGRVYHDQSRFGVSVFDFRVSRAGRAASNGRTPDFVGYGRIPGLGEG